MTTVEIPESDYEHLRRTIAVLERRVNSLENRLEVDAQHPSAFPAINGLQDDIIRITQELFPGKIAIGVTNDPEYPTDAYTVVHAQAAGAINEIEDRRDQWHERVAQLSADCGLLRLSLDYQTNYDR